MASTAHCFYCFECLYSSFKGTDPPSLSVVKELWEAFESSKELLASADYEDSTDYFENDQNKGIRPSAAVNAPDYTSEESDDGVMTGLAPQKAQLRSISRLQGNSSSNSPHSSNLSTPSALSNSSSRSVLTSASSMTSISERTSSSFSETKGVAAGLQTDNADIAYPLFVTWNTLSSSGHKSLRGCIGTFEPQELEAGLKSYALTSDTLDWTLGKHGIRISFTHRGRRLGATYLPDVAVEQGWTKEETMESLMRKAGWEGCSSSSGGKASRAFLRGGLSSASKANNAVKKPWEEVSEFKTVRYQGLKASASYAEWQKWRKWVGSSSDRQGLLESGM
ncbi:hypothetical protein PABG_12537 [Paracoccidioides brasiliensis Pb03]|nr:hypothetical protein PABG_12537 [Paracoccidioides brasiliensis Pb03]